MSRHLHFSLIGHHCVHQLSHLYRPSIEVLINACSTFNVNPAVRWVCTSSRINADIDGDSLSTRSSGITSETAQSLAFLQPLLGVGAYGGA